MTPEYKYIIPALTLPWGPLLLAAALRWRDARGRLLLGMVLLPMRGVYDILPLWIIPKSRTQMFALVGLSWIVPLINFKMSFAPICSVPLLYLPALAFVLYTGRSALKDDN
jgi:hypothetical protein